MAARLLRDGQPLDITLATIAQLELDIVPFGAEHAYAAARLISQTSRFGLSLADRAWLALGQELHLPVLTANRVWSRMPEMANLVQPIR